MSAGESGVVRPVPRLCDMAMHIYWFVLGGLAVWRVSYLLTSEGGPGDMLVNIRNRLTGGFPGKIMGCLYCMSIWIAAPVAWMIGESSNERLLLWPGLSAAAIVIEKLVHREDQPASPVYYEEERQRDVLR